jgi:hypothetical protein
MFVAAVGAVALLSMGVGTAQAITYEGLWDGGCTSGNGTASCQADEGTSISLDIKFTINANRLFTTTSVGLDLSAMGIGNTAVVGQGFSSGIGGATTVTLNGVLLGGPAFAAATADASCIANLAGCDHRFTSFGFTVSPSAGSGVTYTAGTITFDLTGATPGTYTIAVYQSTGVDAPDNTNNPHFDAVINVIPEPGTASLLGLGMLGLVMAGRRRS